MGRTQSRANSRAPSTGLAPDSAADTQQRREKKPYQANKASYKARFELVKEKRARMKIKERVGREPPAGYTYLPIGYADLTKRCKELSRKYNAEVSAISIDAGGYVHDPNKISHHIYRTGHHFRTDIFDEACEWVGYHTNDDGRLIKTKGRGTMTEGATGTRMFNAAVERSMGRHKKESAETVKDAIRELFPEIPNEDVEQIYARAWDPKNKTNVGHAKGESLGRRVQLATIAHLRHQYTDYDKLFDLRMFNRDEIRSIVEPFVLQKMKEWRGEAGGFEEEEVLREVIYIDDDDDEDSPPGRDLSSMDIQSPTESDDDVQFISRRIRPDELSDEPNDPTWLRKHVGSSRNELHQRRTPVRSERTQPTRERYVDISQPAMEAASADQHVHQYTHLKTGDHSVPDPTRPVYHERFMQAPYTNPPSYQEAPQHHRKEVADGADRVSIQVQNGQPPPDHFMMDGVVYKRAPVNWDMYPPPVAGLPARSQPRYGQQDPLYRLPVYGKALPSAVPQFGSPPVYDQPLPSIEGPYGAAPRRPFKGKQPEVIDLTGPSPRKQPVFGQPAYPQVARPLAQMTPAPVHGAPASVQQISRR